MFIVGHTLVWHNQTPAWFFLDEEGNPNTPEAQIERMRSHIETVAGRYSGRVQAWDVVNEVIADDGSYRPTNWVEAIGDGDELIKLAFDYASQYAPEIEQRLAERYAELFRIFYSKRDKIDRVTFWAPHDGLSWKNGYSIPHRTNYPMLFDRERKPKPAFKAVLEIPMERE